jgi:hypothetical protein
MFAVKNSTNLRPARAAGKNGNGEQRKLRDDFIG